MQPVVDYNEVLRRLESLGWNVKIQEKNGAWQASGSPTKEVKGERPITRVGNSAEWALLALYNHVKNKNMMRSLPRTAAWTVPWHNMSEQIAKAYAKAPTYDSTAVPHYQALANESKKQADAIRNQITVERTGDPDPYMDIKDLMNDVHKNQHLLVSTHDTSHPIWNKEQHIDTRIAHSILGHAHSGGDHTWLGRNKAVASHMPHVTSPAREALFTEKVGRAAYNQHFDGNAPNKTMLMSDFLSPVQEDNGEHLHVPHGSLDVLHVSHLLDELEFTPVTAFIPYT